MSPSAGAKGIPYRPSTLVLMVLIFMVMFFYSQAELQNNPTGRSISESQYGWLALSDGAPDEIIDPDS